LEEVSIDEPAVKETAAFVVSFINDMTSECGAFKVVSAAEFERNKERVS